MTWREHSLVTELAEGARGTGSDRGQVGVADFPAGVYPACSLHGALIRVGVDPAIWRCLVHSCNAGAMTPTPWVASDPYDIDPREVEDPWTFNGLERGPDGELLAPDGTPFYGRLETGGSAHVIPRSES